jgi:hypothetical protein
MGDVSGPEKKSFRRGFLPSSLPDEPKNRGWRRVVLVSKP